MMVRLFKVELMKSLLLFEQEDLSCAVKALGSRIYLDRGRKQDYGRFWAAIFQLKNSVGIAENLLECFWYNGTEKEITLKAD